MNIEKQKIEIEKMYEDQTEFEEMYLTGFGFDYSLFIEPNFKFDFEKEDFFKN